MEVLACIGVIAIIAGLGFGIWKAVLWINDVNFELSNHKHLGDQVFELRSDMKKTHDVLSQLVALNELQQPSMLGHISPEFLEGEVHAFCKDMYNELNQFYPSDRYIESKDSKDTTVHKRIEVLKTRKEG